MLDHEFEASLLTQATFNANSSDKEEISSKMFELKRPQVTTLIKTQRRRLQV